MTPDAHVNSPVISSELPGGASRWPFRVGDLGPFGLIDAAATVGAASVSANSVSANKIDRSYGQRAVRSHG